MTPTPDSPSDPAPSKPSEALDVPHSIHYPDGSALIRLPDGSIGLLSARTPYLVADCSPTSEPESPTP